MESDDQAYVGPRQFERKDEKIFFGRKQETSELVSLVIAHSEVLLHAASGAGKSSVVNARLRPLLEREGIEILQPARVQGALKDVATPNIFVFHTLMSWAENTAAVQGLASLSLKEFLHQHARSFASGNEPSSKPRLMIFDQFEEIFTSCLDRWEERRGFFEQVRDALDDDPLLRALFVMRSDYLGQLDRYAPILPQKLRTRFYLERLRKKAALTAVVEPAKYLGRSFKPGVAESIVMGLLQIQVETAPGKSEPRPGEFVEPVQLQIVCQNLWHDLPDGTTEITEQYLTAADVETALLTFYEKSIAEAAQKTGVPEPRLRGWFENELITPAGTRGTVFRGVTETAGLSNEAVDVLEQLRLVRSEERGGARWFELTHDRFIDAIKKSRENWWATRAGAAETLKRLKMQAVTWVGANRSKDLLLNPAELLEATRLRESPDAMGITFPPEVVALIEWSEVEVIAAQREQELALESAQKVAAEQSLRAELEARLASQHQLQRRIALVRQLVAQTQKYKEDKLDLALLLGLEAIREGDEIVAEATEQVGVLSAQEADSLVAEARGGLLSALVASPYLWKFLHGHGAAVRTVAFSPDGSHIVTASADGTLIVWNEAGLPVSPPLGGDSGVVWDVAFSPDGLRFASCAHDGTVTFWDVATLQPLGLKLNMSESPVYGIAFNPTGDKLAMCGADGLIRLWNVSRGEQDGLPLQAHQGPVYRLTFSPDGKTLASCGSDHTVIEWDLEKRNVRRQLKKHTNEVFSVAFSPDGAILASAGRDNNIILWDESTGEPIGNSLVGHTGSVYSVAFSPNGELLVSGSADKTIRKWNVATREQIGVPPTGHSQRIYSVAFRPGLNTFVAAGSASGVTTLWGVDDERLQLATIKDKGGWIWSATYSHNGNLLALGLATGHILLLNMANSSEDTLEKHPAAVTSIAFSADDSRMVSADVDGTLVIWDTASKMPVGEALPNHLGQIWTVAANPRNNMIASGGQDGRVILWDLAGPTLNFTRRLEHHRGPLRALAYSPEGRWLASGGLDGTVFLWEMPEVESPTALLNGQIGAIYSLAFSHDGETLAAGGEDGTILLWDLASRKQSELAEHRDIVTSLVFSRDGQTLASGSEDKTVMLWNVTTRQPIGRLVANGQDKVYGIALGDNGLLLAGSSKAIFWDVSFDELRARAGFIAAAWLNQKDWQRHFGNESYQIRSPHGLFLLAYWNALAGDTEAARGGFEQAVQAAAATNDIELNNNIAWYGSVHGFADVVVAAGDRAVELASKPASRNWRPTEDYRDTRGIARALSGNFVGAISDFTAFVEYASKKPMHEPQIRRRENWIAELKAGRNPLDTAEMRQVLLRETNP